MNKYIWHKSNVDPNSPGSIHATLAHGSLQDIKSLIQNLGKEKVIEAFKDHPEKLYSPTKSLSTYERKVYNTSKLISPPTMHVDDIKTAH